MSEVTAIRYEPVDRSNDGFVAYVDSLREKFAIRVEVDDRKSVLSTITGLKEPPDLDKALRAYLEAQLPKGEYEIQQNNSSSLHYVWFMHKDDALAFMLKWHGRIV